MRKAILFLLALISAQATVAQDEVVNIQLETRIDYQRVTNDGKANHDASGFKGQYLNVRIDGKLNDKLSYSYRQRLNKAHKDQSFFDATDWIHITYKADEHWSFSGGKQIVGIGGFEYDRAPIDLYENACSEYWNNIPCYQLGASVAYDLKGGKDKIMAQVCESPFSGHQNDAYAYNLMWYGTHGCLNTIYSVNMIEYLRGKYISYIALGHQLNFGKVALELDLMNRATDQQTYFFKDCSVMGELSWHPTQQWKLWGKMTYDVNKTQSPGDICVQPGTELTTYSAGVEYFPLKNKDLRLHAYASCVSGKNGNPSPVLTDKLSVLNLGLKWRINLLNLKKS